jgi:prepilin-type N-terminal cleavage/methylation domain-containing protein
MPNVRVPRARAGFTLLELMIVMSMVVMLTTITFPRLSRWRTRYELRSAKVHVATAIATARAAAVQKGRRARLRVVGNRISVTVDTNAAGLAATVIPPTDLYDRYGVTIRMEGGTGDSLVYVSRGVVEQLGAMPRYYFAGPAGRDSLCVSGVGLLVKKGCIL